MRYTCFVLVLSLFTRASWAEQEPDSGAEIPAEATEEIAVAPPVEDVNSSSFRVDWILYPLDIVRGGPTGATVLSLGRNHWEWEVEGRVAYGRARHSVTRTYLSRAFAMHTRFRLPIWRRAYVTAGGVEYHQGVCEPDAACSPLQVPITEDARYRLNFIQFGVVAGFEEDVYSAQTEYELLLRKQQHLLPGVEVVFGQEDIRSAGWAADGRASNRVQREVGIGVRAGIPVTDGDSFSPVGAHVRGEFVFGAPAGLALSAEVGAHPTWGYHSRVSIGLSLALLGFDANEPVQRTVAPRVR